MPAGPRDYTVVYTGNNITELRSIYDTNVYTYNGANQLTARTRYRNGQIIFRIAYTYNGQGQLVTQSNDFDGTGFNLVDSFFYTNIKVTETRS